MDITKLTIIIKHISMKDFFIIGTLFQTRIYLAIFSSKPKERKFLHTNLRSKKYLNNLIEQDHRRIKWKTKDALGYQSYKTAYNTIRGIETMHMLSKKQLYHLFSTTAKDIKNFIERQFGLPAT